jgi:hypothetical protein
MNGSRPVAVAMPEVLDLRPALDVTVAEYRRLLGYPPGHIPGERACELEDWARRHYAAHGRPWIYMRPAELAIGDDSLLIDGEPFHSRRFRELLSEARADGAMIVAVSAGRSCEDHARKLWLESKPDEYFFLEVFGSAVVEHLVSLANGRICERAERDGRVALPHYSPGYTGWDVSDQNKLLGVVTRGMARPFPEPLEALPSGMLRPKKSLLAVVGLAARDGSERQPAGLIPCQSCTFSPCQYRRAPYWYSSKRALPQTDDPGPPMTQSGSPLSPDARYKVNPKALRKWSSERVRISRFPDGSVQATFRFDGTTCSNLGRPLAFDYVVGLGPPRGGYALLNARCTPAPGDTGHQAMCAYIADAPALMAAIDAETPPLGRPLDELLAWAPSASTSGCHCDAASRAHKWVLALEAIHYTLVQADAASADSSKTRPSPP